MIELSGSEEEEDEEMDAIWDDIENSESASKKSAVPPTSQSQPNLTSQAQSQDNESQKLSLGFDQSQSQQDSVASQLP